MLACTPSTAIWRPGWTGLHRLRVPAAARRANPVVVTQLQDINAHGTIAGNLYGLTGKAFEKVRHIDPVLCRCAFGAASGGA